MIDIIYFCIFLSAVTIQKKNEYIFVDSKGYFGLKYSKKGILLKLDSFNEYTDIQGLCGNHDELGESFFILSCFIHKYQIRTK